MSANDPKRTSTPLITATNRRNMLQFLRAGAVEALARSNWLNRVLDLPLMLNSEISRLDLLIIGQFSAGPVHDHLAALQNVSPLH
jgi:hypothetical protein